EAWWPPGHALGYEHTFVHQARDMVLAVAEETAPAPSFEDGLQVQRVLAAVEDSAERNCVYTPVPA
ncbi:gfo/Idh/MocA family oxidoreductase, partial [Streptomyces sp. RKCA-744]|nr:gfo/Idh/MocA family oxidoreductase [Streptomyces sp. RKCA744]